MRSSASSVKVGSHGKKHYPMCNIKHKRKLPGVLFSKLKTGDHVIQYARNTNTYFYQPVKKVRGNSLELASSVVVSRNQVKLVKHVKNFEIGTVCLAGLIDTEDPDEAAVEMRKFTISSVGQNYCFGKFENDSNEIKVSKMQLCKLEESDSKEVPNHDKSSDLKHSSLSDTNEQTNCNTIKILTEINRKVMEEFYVLDNQYKLAREELKENKQKLVELNSMYVESLESIALLESELANEKNISIDLKEKLNEINTENENLKRQINHLRVCNEIVKVTYERRLVRAENENVKLMAEKNDDKDQYNELKRKSVEVCEEDGDTLKIRPIGAHSKPSVYIKLPQVLKNSTEFENGSNALKLRARKLYSVLVDLSGPNARKEDLVRTLQEFFHQNPELSHASSVVSQKLSPGECLDLKTFLQLPMYRFRKLKEFLECKGISMIAPESHIRQEIIERNKGKEVEVEVVNLKRKSKDETESKVALVRNLSVKRSIEASIESSTVSKFNGEIFIKLGGDKGGASSKIVYEIVGNSAVNVILMFEATDSYENLWKTILPIREELLSLHGAKFNVEGTEVSARVFLYGDYDFLCQILGHQGASSSFPCEWCLVPLSDLQSRSGEVHSPFILTENGELIKNEHGSYAERTVKSYQDDFESNKKNSTDGNLNKTGKFYHNIVNQMILVPHDLNHVVPPCLHILLGLTLRFFNILLDMANEQDNQSEKSDVSDRDKLLKHQHEIEESIAQSEEKINAMLFLQSKLVGRAKRVKGGCAAPKCVSYDDENVLVCNSCNNLFHAKCLGLSENEYVVHHKVASYTCILCEGLSVENIDQFISAEISSAKIQKELDEVKLNKIGKDLQENFDENVESQTELSTEGKLLKMLDSIGVDRQAFHSKSFIGNHCIKILQNSSELVAVLHNDDDRKMMHELFDRFYEIYKIMSLNRILSDEEIDTLVRKCYSFGAWYPKNFPGQTLPMKFHMLVYHVPKFVKCWKSLGMFSEQLAESIHNKSNAFHRTYSSTRNRGKQLELVYSSLTLQAQMPSRLKPIVARKCSMCRSFLKKVNAEKRCPKCEPQYFVVN